MKLPESLEKFKQKQQPTASSAAVVGSGSGGGKTFPDSLERLMQRAGKTDGGGSPKAFAANRQLVRAASNLSAPSDGISSHGDTSRAPSAVPQKKGRNRNLLNATRLRNEKAGTASEIAKRNLFSKYCIMF
jgi:hypothetical protein